MGFVGGMREEEVLGTHHLWVSQSTHLPCPCSHPINTHTPGALYSPPIVSKIYRTKIDYPKVTSTIYLCLHHHTPYRPSSPFWPVIMKNGTTTLKKHLALYYDIKYALILKTSESIYSIHSKGMISLDFERSGQGDLTKACMRNHCRNNSGRKEGRTSFSSFLRTARVISSLGRMRQRRRNQSLA